MSDPSEALRQSALHSDPEMLMEDARLYSEQQAAENTGQPEREGPATSSERASAAVAPLDVERDWREWDLLPQPDGMAIYDADGFRFGKPEIVTYRDFLKARMECTLIDRRERTQVAVAPLEQHKPRWEQGRDDPVGMWRCGCAKTFAPDDFEGYWRHLSLPEPLDVEWPWIVCLCGSTRFYSAFQRANYEETMAGRIVLSVGFYPHSAPEAHGEQIGVTPEQKAALDELHLRKIDLADEVLVLNQGSYIGESTRREIAHAEATGKPVRYLEPIAAAYAAAMKNEGA